MQTQCLDPYLSYKSPDCIVRQSCDVDFDDFEKHAHHMKLIGATSNPPMISDKQKKKTLFINPATQRRDHNTIPTNDVFSIIILVFMIVIVVWSICTLF